MALAQPKTVPITFEVSPSLTAFIPARKGSKRIPDKNVKLLAGHPLIAHTIATARRSGLFQRVVFSSDSEEYCQIARRYGAIAYLRPREYATDVSPDFEWLYYTARQEWLEGAQFEALAILRPTSPFRGVRSVLRAYRKLCETRADSVRAIRPVSEHPGKMWVLSGEHMLPLMPWRVGSIPWHSNQKQALPKVYVQTAGLEFAWADTLWEKRSISGDVVAPVLLNEIEGLDINDQEDWAYAELLLKAGTVTLEDPTI